MKTEKLQRTSHYDRFVDHENQQPISDKHINRLAEAMRRTGFWPSKPVSVYRRGQELRVIDGHHRVRAARIAGVEVYFVEEPPEKESYIGDVNVTVRKWSAMSYVKLYASRGRKDYQTLLNYVGRGLTLNHSVSVLRGETPGSSNHLQRVQSGTYEVKTTRYAEKILGVVDSCKQAAPEIAKRPYIEAIGSLFWVKGFDPDMLINKVVKNPTMIQGAARRSQALQMLEEVYNFRARKKLPLQFLAEEALAYRQDVGSRRKKNG